MARQAGLHGLKPAWGRSSSLSNPRPEGPGLAGTLRNPPERAFLSGQACNPEHRPLHIKSVKFLFFLKMRLFFTTCEKHS